MSDLLAVSFDAPSSPAFTLKPAPDDAPQGWGFAWYPRDERGAALIGDPTAFNDQPGPSIVQDWERFRSSTFVAHLRGVRPRLTPRDAQPFAKAYGGRDWFFAHQGDLSGDWRRELALADHAVFEPTGSSDSERAFCWLLEWARARGARALTEFGWQVLHELMTKIGSLGTANVLLSDGQTLVAYHGGETSEDVYWSRRTPPHAENEFDGRRFALQTGGPVDSSRSYVLVSSQPLLGVRWIPFEAGQLLVLRRGQLVWNSHPATLEEAIFARREVASQRAALQRPQPPLARFAGERSALAAPISGGGGEPRTQAVLEVVHETVYRYATPVERSTHRFRLEPVQDDRQRLLSYDLAISSPGRRRDYEDVFGNRVVLFDVVEPFTELRLTSRARVALDDPSLQELVSPHRRDQIPLVWMPWQRQMMSPYLLPAELPETQLRELSEYAMGFVERNDFDLVATLLDINRTIYRDFKYVSGSTTVETTPFDVYTMRRGVCQDFANLFIMLARLLSVPARYRAGYIYTGGNYENKIQSEASHAWVEIYLPWTGWRGFDPTNGCLAGPDHVRVACGRHYWDAAPTSGTIYQGGGGETLSVRVEVVDGQDPAQPDPAR